MDLKSQEKNSTYYSFALFDASLSMGGTQPAT